MPELASGSVFAGYRIDRVIGHGAMGVVYAVTRISDGEKCALKILAEEFTQDSIARRRFEREAKLARHIAHPNILPVSESGEAEHQPFLVMPLIDGLDLTTLLAKQGALHPHHAADILSLICSALTRAHDNELLHRDIKPGNILIALNGDLTYIYLTDFGLSKLVSSQSGLTKTGTWVGTVAYAAPEQFQSGTIDARTDIYGLGCVLYETLSGSPPFPRTTEVATMIAHLSERIPSISEHNPKCPGITYLDPVIEMAMAKNADERFSCASEFDEALRAAITQIQPPAISLHDLAKAALADEGKGAPRDST
jgi:serine/threonine protein kinase